MSLWKLVKRSVSFYRRTNVGVFLAAAVGTAILTGALLVGDSVRYSLARMVMSRLGGTEVALVTQDRFFRAELADRLAAELGSQVSPVLGLRGLITNSDGTRRAGRIEVWGVDGRFYKLGASPNPFDSFSGEGVILNEALASRLGASRGDEVVLRISRPGVMPRDIPLSPDSDLSTAFRLPVRGVASEGDFGLFSLQANQASPLNAFVPLRWLSEKLERAGGANVLLAGGAITVEKANEAIEKSLQLVDMGLELRQLEGQRSIELRSSRIFIDEGLGDAAMEAAEGSVGILTYFVNELRKGERVTPYSFVTAIGQSSCEEGVMPADMADDEIVINQWLANDLGAKEGEAIEMSYYTLGPMRKLREERSCFRVRSIVPIKGAAADSGLVPDFPGIAEVKNCRDWKPGVPIELKRIREKDEEYWDMYRGTPKAFVTLKAGQEMWGNRYGKLTAIRYPLSEGAAEKTEAKLLSKVDSASVGLYFQSVRARNIKASNEGTDFGQLFLGLSMFLIVSAVVLTALVFVFGIEKRSQQTGMLKAVGFSLKLIRQLYLLEGVILAGVGAVAGVILSVIYTKAMLYGLANVWRGAVTGTYVHFHLEPETLILGACGGMAVSLFAIWVTLRRQLRSGVHELLSGIQWQFFISRPGAGGRGGLWIATAAIVGAGMLIAVMSRGEGGAAAGVFFGAGALLLIAELSIAHSLLKAAGRTWKMTVRSIGGLGFRNSTRRSGRSLAVVGLLAAGSFLVIAVGANRYDPSAEAERRDSGTGGFGLFAESSIGVLHDLNSEVRRKSLGLEGGEIVQLRVRDGDEASCLNLNRAQQPRLLGVEAGQLQQRRAFAFTKMIETAAKEKGWELLNSGEGDVVPAIGDYTTIVWSLGKSLGDEVEYIDESGRRFRVKLVGMLKNSILQGSLIIAEGEFVRRFPSEEGYRMFLIDAAPARAKAASEKLSYGLRDFGMEVRPAGERLAEFNAVQNTYLSIFQLLGGLGLILGSLGLGMVVLRNVLDRRGELAMLRAVGFGKKMVVKMVLYEHAGLMLAGLLSGAAAGLAAVWPALKSPGASVPYLSLAVTIVCIGISGLVWIWIAAIPALGGRPLDALRNE